MAEAGAMGVLVEISKETREQIGEIARDYRLRLMLLFGSAVTGKLHPGSDLDIAVMFRDADAGRARIFDLIADLESAFPEREVDLGLINGADPLFLKKILENCDLLYGEPRDLAELRMFAFKRYIDHRKYLKMEEEYIRRLLDKYCRGAA